MADTNASNDLRRKLTVVGDDDGAALLPIAVDADALGRPRSVRPPVGAVELTLAQIERWQAAPFRRAA